MNIPMRVHRISIHKVEVDVVFNGETARAELPELEVELMNDDSHGTQVLHFRASAEIAEAKDLFKQGSMVTMSYTADAAAPESITTTADESAGVGTPA